jgi:hypothetical protein
MEKLPGCIGGRMVAIVNVGGRDARKTPRCWKFLKGGLCQQRRLGNPENLQKLIRPWIPPRQPRGAEVILDPSVELPWSLAALR